MHNDFDRVIDRVRSESLKWNRYGDDVLPMWLADLDFKCSSSILQALQTQIDHGIFGYSKEPSELRQIISGRMEERYCWNVSPDDLIFFPLKTDKPYYSNVPLKAYAVRWQEEEQIEEK